MTRGKQLNGRRTTLDIWFPTIVRYAGIVLAFMLVGVSFLGYGNDLAAGFILAAGMIAYKTIHDAARNSDDG